MKTPLRVLILTPTAFPAISGNAVTVERWRRSLTAIGLEVRVLPAQGLAASTLSRVLREWAPHLLHVYHGFRAGSLLVNPVIEELHGHIPLVMSPGGTDLYADWEIAERRAVIRCICRQARFIISQSETLAARLETVMPDTADRVVLVPKSLIWLGDDVFDLRKEAHCAPEDVLFFFPAGIRPVKGNLECLLTMEKLFAARSHVKIVFAGPLLDDAYARRFAREIERLRHGARWIPPIAPSAMRSAYDAADVVLNGSHSEGLSNALIEATAAGRPVLASRIPGNLGPILGNNGDEPAGLLYDLHDPEDFFQKALLLIDRTDVRHKLADAGKKRAALLPPPEEEAAHLAEVYARCRQ